MIIDELLTQWHSLKEIPTSPPSDDILLWQHKSCTVYIDSGWGPPVPYPAIDRHDGTQNHGYISLKGNPNAVNQVPELQGFPEFQEFIRAINDIDSPIESLGCEKGFFPVTDHQELTTYMGSYTDVAFSEVALNENGENVLRLTAALVDAIEGCEQWWGSVALGLQRLRGLHGANNPWGLMIRVTNHGRDEAEARKFWGHTLSLLSASIVKLPKSFPQNSKAPFSA